MSGVINGAANRIADAFRTPEERAERAKQIQDLEVFKTACVVAMTAAAVFFLCIPSFFTFLFCGLIGLAARDARVVATNMGEIIQNITTEMWASWSRDNAVAQLSKDTLVAGYLLNWVSQVSDHLVSQIENPRA
jgi:hypothetical protein